MRNEELTKFKNDSTDLSDIARKVRNLLRRDYCFKNKNVLIATPIYKRNDAEADVRIYNVDKRQYMLNLRDALYLRYSVFRKSHYTSFIEVLTFEEDPLLLKDKLERIDCLILSHNFTKLDKVELISELQAHFDCKEMKIMALK